MKKANIVRFGILVALVALVTVSLLSGTTYAITNGQPDGTNHPYVGLVVFDVDHDNKPETPAVPMWRCTGTLLSPTVVLTAAHCAEGAVAARIWLDKGPILSYPDGEYPYGGATSYEGIPYTNPDFGHYVIGPSKGVPGYSYRDVGIVVLSEPVPEYVVDKYGELPTAGLVDSTRANRIDA